MANTIKIRLLTSVSGSDYSYAAGDVVDAPEHIGRDLVKANFATLVSGTAAPEFKSNIETATDKRQVTKRNK